MAGEANKPPAPRLGDKLAQSLRKQTETNQAAQEQAQKLYRESTPTPAPTNSQEQKP